MADEANRRQNGAGPLISGGAAPLLLRIIDKVFGALAAFFVAASVGAICLNVFYRYVVLGWLRSGAEAWPWLAGPYRLIDGLLAPVSVTADEVPGFMLVWIAFLGAYLALRQGRHISFGLLVERLPPWPRAIVRAAVDGAVLFFFAMLLWLSIRMIGFDGGREIETAEIPQGVFMMVLPMTAAAIILAMVLRIIGLATARRRDD
jgi:TRAP-type C4-dicarboxylate transport system permease small subunit